MSKKTFKLPKSNIPKLNLSGLFNADQVNPFYLITCLYDGVIPSYKRYRDLFDKDKVTQFLKKVGAETVQSSEEVNFSRKNIEDSDDQPVVLGDDIIIPNFESQESSLYFYKDNFIHLTVKDRGSNECNINFFYPSSSHCISKELHEFIIADNQPNVFMVNQEYGQFTFSKFQINLPDPFDLALNYGEDFLDINNRLIDSLHENDSGLFMFHGLPGTGKTTYIRYLASVLNKDIIFFPTSFVNEITNPAILNLLREKQECVLILEDAEKALTKRTMSDEPALVSTLLNMTDGILGDILKLNVIVTYNCDRQDVDEALLRKGRLKAEYSFQGLDKKSAKKLAEKLDLKIKIKDNMTLADLYYAKSDESLIGNVNKLEKPRIGFA